MARFRKRPIEIEARQLVGDEDGVNGQELAEWCGGRVGGTFREPRITIPTLEGDHLASPGDWIIRGLQGEFYPCKPDIFEATYEEVI